MRFILLASLVGLIATGCASSPPPLVDKALKSTKLVREGSEAAEKGEIDKAIKCFEEALELTPNAPKYRFAYAELLYWKALSFSQASHEKWQNTLGRDWVDPLNRWESLDEELSQEEKEKLLKQSAEDKREAAIYFNKSLRQLMRCDIDWNFSVEAVPFAVGMIYIFLEEYNKAIQSFERVLSSARVSDDYRKKTARVIETIKKYQEEIEEQGGDEEEGDLLP
jgi:tetratricopeptide (TPR) repeat protein